MTDVVETGQLTVTPVLASGLKVLQDADVVQTLEKLYNSLVSENDMSRFPDFLNDLDKIFVKYHGDKPVTSEQDEEFEQEIENPEGKTDDEKAEIFDNASGEKTVKPAKKKKKKKRSLDNAIKRVRGKKLKAHFKRKPKIAKTTKDYEAKSSVIATTPTTPKYLPLATALSKYLMLANLK